MNLISIILQVIPNAGSTTNGIINSIALQWGAVGILFVAMGYVVINHYKYLKSDLKFYRQKAEDNEEFYRTKIEANSDFIKTTKEAINSANECIRTNTEHLKEMLNELKMRRAKTE